MCSEGLHDKKDQNVVITDSECNWVEMCMTVFVQQIMHHTLGQITVAI
jgi:hypothetical protein